MTCRSRTMAAVGSMTAVEADSTAAGTIRRNETVSLGNFAFVGALTASHPSRKNKDAARVGHPIDFLLRSGGRYWSWDTGQGLIATTVLQEHCRRKRLHLPPAFLFARRKRVPENGARP